MGFLMSLIFICVIIYFAGLVKKAALKKVATKHPVRTVRNEYSEESGDDAYDDTFEALNSIIERLTAFQLQGNKNSRAKVLGIISQISDLLKNVEYAEGSINEQLWEYYYELANFIDINRSLSVPVLTRKTNEKATRYQQRVILFCDDIITKIRYNIEKGTVLSLVQSEKISRRIMEIDLEINKLYYNFSILTAKEKDEFIKLLGRLSEIVYFPSDYSQTGNELQNINFQNFRKEILSGIDIPELPAGTTENTIVLMLDFLSKLYYIVGVLTDGAEITPTVKPMAEIKTEAVVAARVEERPETPAHREDVFFDRVGTNEQKGAGDSSKMIKKTHKPATEYRYSYEEEESAVDEIIEAPIKIVKKQDVDTLDIETLNVEKFETPSIEKANIEKARIEKARIEKANAERLNVEKLDVEALYAMVMSLKSSDSMLENLIKGNYTKYKTLKDRYAATSNKSSDYAKNASEKLAEVAKDVADAYKIIISDANGEKVIDNRRMDLRIKGFLL